MDLIVLLFRSDAGTQHRDTAQTALNFPASRWHRTKETGLFFHARVRGILGFEFARVHSLRGFDHLVILAQDFVIPSHSRVFRNPYCRNVAFAVASVSLFLPITRTSFPLSPANFIAFPNNVYS
jgi:hypothetical protein